MSKHETPLTCRYWKEQVGGTLAHEYLVIRQTATNGRRLIDGVIVPDGPEREVHWQDLDIEGKDIVCVQTKAARLSIHLLGQAFFSRKLLLRHCGARSVRTVAICTIDDSVLRPIAEDLGIEVVGLEGYTKGTSHCIRVPEWETRFADGMGTLVRPFRAVTRSATNGQRSIPSVIVLGGPEGELSGRRGHDVEGRDVVAMTTTNERPGMYSLGEALFNRILLVRHCGARSVRTVVLCGKDEAVLRPIAAELGIEMVVMGPEESKHGGQIEGAADVRA